MGAALGPLALVVFNAGFTGLANALVGVGLGGTILAGAARIALGIGASLVAQRLLAPKPKPSDNQTETRQPVPPRSWVYGRSKVSGPMAFWEAKRYTDGTGTHQTLFKIVMFSCREIDAIEEYYLDDRAVELNGDLDVTTAPYVTTSPVKNMVRISGHLGTDAQTADAMMLEAWPTEWTADHKLSGIAYAAVRLKAPTDPTNFSQIYPSAEPPVQALIRGGKLYDPRLDSTVTSGSGSHRSNDKSTWAWSENSGLAVLDWLHHTDGYAIPIAEIDLQSFQDFADVCDDPVALADGGTEARYRVSTTVYLSEPRTDVLTRLLESCDGQIYRNAQGKIAIRGGTYAEPTVTIADDPASDLHHILRLTMVPPDGLSRYNELVIQYVEPQLGYVEAECDPWRDQDDIDDHGLNSRTLDLTQVPSFSQARRLAKIRMAKENPDWLIDAQTTLAGINAIGEEVVALDYPEMLIDGPFWLDGGPTIDADWTGVAIRLRSTDPDAYDWTTAEEGAAPTIPGDVGESAVMPLDYSRNRATFHWLFLNGL